MKKLNFGILFSVIIMALSACSDDFARTCPPEPVGPCPSGPFNIEFRTYNIPQSAIPDDMDEEKVYIISSAREFEKYFGDFEGREAIDFKEFQLVFVHGWTNYYPALVSRRLHFDHTETCRLDLYVSSGLGAALDHWNCALLVRRHSIPDNITLSVSRYEDGLDFVHFEEYEIPTDPEPECLTDHRVYVIWSAEEYRSVFGVEADGIDFQTSVLLYVKGQLSNGIESMSTELIQYDEDMYAMQLRIHTNDATEAPKWNRALVVKRTSWNVFVDFHLYLYNGQF